MKKWYSSCFMEISRGKKREYVRMDDSGRTYPATRLEYLHAGAVRFPPRKPMLANGRRVRSRAGVVTFPKHPHERKLRNAKRANAYNRAIEARDDLPF